MRCTNNCRGCKCEDCIHAVASECGNCIECSEAILKHNGEYVKNSDMYADGFTTRCEHYEN